MFFFRKHRTKNRRGATTVEFAMTVPIVFLFLFASLEFMRAYNLVHTADNAAYEAARLGTTPGATAAEVESTAASVLSVIGVNDAVIDVQPPTIDLDTDDVTVTVTIPMNTNGIVAPFFLKDRAITAEMTMTREAFSQTNVGP